MHGSQDTAKACREPSKSQQANSKTDSWKLSTTLNHTLFLDFAEEPRQGPSIRCCFVVVCGAGLGFWQLREDAAIDLCTLEEGLQNELEKTWVAGG